MHQKTMQDNSKEIKTRRKETNHVKTHQKLSVSRHKLCLLCCNTPWLIKKPKLSLAPIQEAHFTMVWYKFWRKLIFSILIVALVILKCCCTSWLHRIWRNISWKCCCIKIIQRYRTGLMQAAFCQKVRYVFQISKAKIFQITILN